MHNLGLLLTTNFRCFANSLRYGKAKQQIGLAAAILFLAPFGIGLGFAVYAVTVALVKVNAVNELTILVNAGLGISLILVLLSSFTFAITSLYEAKDIPLLLSSPVTPGTVFMFKLLSSYFTMTGIVILFFLPPVIALGAALHSGIIYYLFALVSLLLYLSIPVCIGQLLTIVVLHFIPAGRSKEIITVLGTIIAGVFWLVTQTLPHTAAQSGQQPAAALQAIHRVPNFISWLPSGWAANILVQMARANYALGLGNFVLLSAVTILLAALCLLAVKTLYLSGWTNSRRTKRKSGVKNSLKESSLLIWLSSPRRALFIKDWKCVARNPQELSQLILPIFMMIFFLWRQSSLATEDSALRYLNIFFFGFMTSSLCSGMAARALPREREEIKLLLVSPLSTADLLWGKFWLSYIPSTVIGEVCLVVSSILTGTATNWLEFAAMPLAVLVFNALGLAVGTFYGVYNTTNPKKMLTGTGSLLLITAIFVTLTVYAAVTVGAYILYGFGFHIGAYTAGITAFLLVTALGLFLPMQASIKKLQRHQWQLDFENLD